MDRGAWWTTVHGAAKSQTRLKRLSMHPPPSLLWRSCCQGPVLRIHLPDLLSLVWISISTVILCYIVTFIIWSSRNFSERVSLFFFFHFLFWTFRFVCLFLTVSLFTWLHWVFVGAHRLRSCENNSSSLVVAGGLSRPEATCGILAPSPGTGFSSPALEGGFLTTGPQGGPWTFNSGSCVFFI